LVCFGIDTLADIYINQQLLKSVDNMHRTWRIPCKQMLKAGENEIRIELKSPLKYIRNYKTQEGKDIHYTPTGGITGNQFIRKGSSMFGWDWGIQLPDMGIWRMLELQGYDCRLDDVQILQEHKEDKVALNVQIHLAGQIKPDHAVLVTILSPDGDAIEKTLTFKENFGSEEIMIENAKLWWPNGYGDQPLYQVTLALIQGKNILEKQMKQIGLRTLTISQEKDQWGSEFAFRINGIKIFARGADYIPEDAVYPRITVQKIDNLLKASVKANFNCLRVWGGGYYPGDEFYDLCDRYGLIVWQDLMYACNIYDFTKKFEKSIIEETIDNVNRIRHHACLGLWCGNNEMETGWVYWDNFNNHSEKLRTDYIKQFEYVLPKVVAEKDSQTFYWPSSPSSGGCFDQPNDENRGDVHYWDVWHGQKPFEDYENYYFRFCSEFGFQSFPNIKTVRTYTMESDRNIFSRVMEAHQKNPTANGKILSYIADNFLYPKNFESILYISQILQGLAVKFGVEHWRRNRGRCMGSLYWQLNDNWPVASWSSIDYFGRWKALHYMARNFYAPLAGSIRRSGDETEIYVQNETRQVTACTITISLKRFDFTVIEQEQMRITVPALSSVPAALRNYSDKVKNFKESCFLGVHFSWEDGYEAEEVAVFVSYKYLILNKPNYKIHMEEKEELFEIRINSDTFTLFTELDMKDYDGVFSDNYFPITDEKGKRITLSKCDIQSDVPLTLEILKQQLKIFSLGESYE
jgi:beta-mannosidase